MAAQDQEYLPTNLSKEIPAHTHTDHGQTHEQSAYQVRTLLAWHAPGRPFKKRGREYFVLIILIALLIEIILYLFSLYMLMLVVVSLVFLACVLATVPPTDFHYRISTEGITIEDHSYLWDELYDFYFKKRYGTDVLHVRTRAFLPGELTINLGSIHKEHIKTILLRYLPYRERVKQTFVEKSGDWLAKTFPLEQSPPQDKVASES